MYGDFLKKCWRCRVVRHACETNTSPALAAQVLRLREVRREINRLANLPGPFADEEEMEELTGEAEDLADKIIKVRGRGSLAPRR